MAPEAYGLHLFRYGRIEEGLVPITQCLDVLRRVNQSGTHGFANTPLWKAGAETDLGHYREAEAALAEVSAIHARLNPPPTDYPIPAARPAYVRFGVANPYYLMRGINHYEFSTPAAMTGRPSFMPQYRAREGASVRMHATLQSDVLTDRNRVRLAGVDGDPYQFGILLAGA